VTPVWPDGRKPSVRSSGTRTRSSTGSAGDRTPAGRPISDDNRPAHGEDRLQAGIITGHPVPDKRGSAGSHSLVTSASTEKGRTIMRLKDKVAIITGGAHGMGEAEARLFAAEGAKVVVADILAESAEAIVTDIRTSGGEAIAAKIDVTSEAEWIGLIAKTVVTYGRLDILVNNAGISGSSVGDPDGLDGWHRIIAVNQTSVFLGTRLAAYQIAKTGGGSIVNISSIMGFVGSTSGHPAYHASKGAVRIYSKAAAVRYGPSGVRVNTVHPGYMPPMLNATNAGERDDKIALTPLRRIGKPIEVAYGVLFLASDEASFVTGAELVIDGGYIAQ